MEKDKNKVLVVGSGIGGLSIAVRLLKRGYDVTILEKEESIGGRTSCKCINGTKFDLTGSILINKDIYTELFDDVGVDYNDYIKINELDTLYKVFYPDGSNRDFYKGDKRMSKVLEEIEKGLSYKYFSMIEKSYEKYKIIRSSFLNKKLDGVLDFIKNDSFRKGMKLSPCQNSYDYIKSFMENEKIINYLLFQTMYIGVNPYKSSNIHTLIPAITQKDGLIYIEGGFYSYVLALEKIIENLGGKILKSTAVEKIIRSRNKIIGVSTNKGFMNSDIVVCNADFSYTIENLFDGDIKEGFYNNFNIEKKKQSVSVFMLYLETSKVYESLGLHNIYLNKRFRHSIESAFKGKISASLSMYIYNQVRNNKNILNIMIRVPNLNSDIIWREELVQDLSNRIIKELKNITGLEDIDENIIAKDYLTPVYFKEKFNAYDGNAFALSHTLAQSAYLRPSMKSKSTKGLYFIGGSTHPGNGISVIIESSKLLAKIIEKDE